MARRSTTADDDEVQYEGFDMRKGCLFLAILGVLMFFFLATVVAIGAAVYYMRAKPSPDKPDRTPTEIAVELEKILQGPNKEKAAWYLGTISRSVSNKLQQDFSDLQGTECDTVAEAVALYGNVGKYFAATQGMNTFSGLPELMEELNSNALGGKDGKVPGGNLNPGQQQNLVQMWAFIADACEEVRGE